jgi:hypothetical protein
MANKRVIEKMASYIWYSGEIVKRIELFNSANFFDAPDIVSNEALMMIPGSYAEMRKDYDDDAVFAS